MCAHVRIHAYDGHLPCLAFFPTLPWHQLCHTYNNEINLKIKATAFCRLLQLPLLLQQLKCKNPRIGSDTYFYASGIPSCVQCVCLSCVSESNFTHRIAACSKVYFMHADTDTHMSIRRHTKPLSLRHGY